MFEILSKLLNDGLVVAQINAAISEGKGCSIRLDNAHLNIIPDGEGCIIKLLPINVTKKEIENFTDYLKHLPDDIFQGTCETLGDEKLKELSKLLDSGDLEQVRNSITLFKNAVRAHVIKCLNTYKTLLKTC